MADYKLAMQKTPTGGFAQSPPQDQGNASSPSLNAPLTAKNAIGLAGAVMYGKKVFNSGYKATVEQLGNAELEFGVALIEKGAGYIAIGAATGGIGLVLAVSAEVATTGITYRIESHKEQLDNEQRRVERGVRNNLRVSGFYG